MRTSQLDLVWFTPEVGSVKGVAEMTAVGLGLPKETFIDASRYGYVQ